MLWPPGTGGGSSPGPWLLLVQSDSVEGEETCEPLVANIRQLGHEGTGYGQEAYNISRMAHNYAKYYDEQPCTSIFRCISDYLLEQIPGSSLNKEY